VTLLRWIRPARRWPPDCVKVSLLVCVCTELMPRLVTFRSRTPMTFRPKSFMHRFLIVHELDFA
jgi:hypothetical protein